MADMTKYKPDGSTQTRVSKLSGWFISAGAGAITQQAAVATSTSGGQQCGVTVTRNAVGDFRFTLHRGYKRLIYINGCVTNNALGAAPGGAVTAVGNVTTSAYFTGATPVPATASIGLSTLSAAGALADPTAGVVVSFEVEVADI